MVMLHLRIRVTQARREEFLAFLRRAIPFYERPGGIRIRLLADRSDSERFIEVVEYADQAAYELDQHRVEHDPEMRGFLETWRGLLAEPPVVEIYTEVAVGYEDHY